MKLDPDRVKREAQTRHNLIKRYQRYTDLDPDTARHRYNPMHDERENLSIICIPMHNEWENPSNKYTPMHNEQEKPLIIYIPMHNE